MTERQGVEPHARVDARHLESALLALRHRIVDAPLLLEAPGVAEARAERKKLLTQIDDYLLPRIASPLPRCSWPWSVPPERQVHPGEQHCGGAG